MTDNNVVTESEYEVENEVVASIRNVSLKYAGEKGDVVALDNINLDIHKGEFICLIGPSGCGKSSLLNIIAGFHQPTEGTAMMGDVDITEPDSHRGVIFQTPTLYPWLNVYENVVVGPEMRKVDEEKVSENVEKYLELVGLKNFKKKKPYELSKDMRQRAALARVLVNQPDIILMDEPFSALDAITRVNMQTLTREIWQKTGNTVFFITNDVDEALTLATRVIVMSMHPGCIVREFYTEFTNDVGRANQQISKYSGKYMEIRQEVLNIINNQNITLSSSEV